MPDPPPPPTTLTLTTGDVTYPTVTARIDVNGYRKGIDREFRPWRQIIYQIEDLADGKAQEKSDVFMDALMGITQVDILTNWNLSKYLAPHRYPFNTRLACVQADAEPLPGFGSPADKLHGSIFVRVTALYQPLPYSVGSLAGDPEGLEDQDGHSTFGDTVWPYVTVRKTQSSKSYTIDRSSLKVADDPDDDKNITRGFQVQQPIYTYHITYHRVPWMGDDFDAALTRTVNIAPLNGFATGTLRYDGSEAEPTGIGAGNLGYDVTVAISHNPLGWNKEIPAGRAAAETITFIDDETVFPYALTDYSILAVTLPAPP